MQEQSHKDGLSNPLRREVKCSHGQILTACIKEGCRDRAHAAYLHVVEGFHAELLTMLGYDLPLLLHCGLEGRLQQQMATQHMACTAAAETVSALQQLSPCALSCCMAPAEDDPVMPVKPVSGGAALRDALVQRGLSTCLTITAHFLASTGSSVSGRVTAVRHCGLATFVCRLCKPIRPRAGTRSIGLCAKGAPMTCALWHTLI